MRRLATLILIASAMAACSSEGTTVAMVDGRRFEPATLTVSVGDNVIWTNESDESHTVTSLSSGADSFGSGNFDSVSQARGSLTEALITPGGDYSVQFTDSGTYEYVCIPHEDQGMKGTIVVEG